VLRFQEGEIQVGEAIELDLMLVRSVEGIQRFDITISIENPSIARMQGVSGGVISGAFFKWPARLKSLLDLGLWIWRV
jgi:hypothetical protein